jgi:hypothetical protein
MYSEWPTETDIAALGQDADLDGATAGGGYVSEAIAMFQSRTGWNTWLPGGTESQYLDPPRLWQQDNLYLKFPVTSGASVYAWWSESTQSGTLLTENIDYEWVTYPFPGGNEGIYGIRFLRSPGTTRRSIKITGIRGTSCEIPDDLYQAILDGAFGMAIPVFRGQADGPVAEEKTGPVSTKYGIEAGRSKEDVLKANFEKAIQRYTPLSI